MSDEQDLPLEPVENNCDVEAMLEALIFVSKEPLTSERMVDALRAFDVDIDTRAVNKALSSLLVKWNEPSRSHARGMVLQRIAGGYVFTSDPGQSELLKKMTVKKVLQLTKAQVEVLSIVAYRQPITRVDIDDIRGVDSSFAVKKLMQLKFLKILGKSEGLGRALLYGTTKHFLEFFALNSLNDLPTLKQFEALGKEDIQEVDLTDEHVTVKDLFKESNDASMFSKDVQRLSDEAMMSLDEALLRITDVEKISGE